MMAAELGIGWRREAGFETVAGPFTAVRLASRPLPFLAVLAVALTAADKIRSRQHASGASRSTECLDAETLRAAALILENATMRGESSAVWIGRDEIEWELSKTLREAAWVFENEKNGRFHGSIAACKGVARFIYLRGGGAELAGPFGQIAAAFEDLEKGGKPGLFSKKTVSEKERSRSPERKHLHTPAAACLEVLAKLGDSVDVTTESKASAADRAAAGVKRWPGMLAQEVTAVTVVNWRKQQRRSSDRKFEAIVAMMMAEPDPRGTVEHLLQNGPPPPNGVVRNSQSYLTTTPALIHPRLRFISSNGEVYERFKYRPQS